MADRCKFLKIENPANGGTETDPFPVEADPTEDYGAMKGLAFENLDTFLLDKIGRAIVEKFPTLYHSVTYASGDVSVVEFFNSASFINANRVARYDLTYTGSDLTSEILRIYDTDGTTVLRTYTWTHTYSSGDFASSGVVTT